MMKSKFLKTTVAALLCTACALPVSAGSAPVYKDEMLTAPVTVESVAKGLELDAYNLGLSAYTWGYPLVRMERVMREYTSNTENAPATSYRAPLNQIGWARELATSDALDMPTANNDTAYLSAVVSLDEPYILTVPELDDRYYVVDAFNMWHELEHYVGRRTTGTEAGRFAFVPPNWEGELPADVTRLDVTTDKVWLWGRMRVSEQDSMEEIHALQDAFDLRPLSADGVEGWTAPAADLEPLPEIGEGPLGFLTHLQAALQANDVKPEDEAIYGQLERIGFTKDGFDASKLSPPQIAGLTRAIEDGFNVGHAAVARSTIDNEGWNYPTGLDSFGWDYSLRALISGPYLGGQGLEEALYALRVADVDGELLTGSKTYTLKFDKEPPNDAFWSLTAYDAETKMLIGNPLNRYKIGSDTEGLKINDDGTLEITVSAEQPADTSNWLPASEGGFYMLMRIYQPQDEVLDNEWSFPQVVAE